MSDDQKQNADERTERDQRAQRAPQGARKDQGGAASGEGAGDLDLSQLDLSVEEVEERISPSETNVFDK
ncbi:MAG: hypothetical protein ACYS26_00970 [Planctomycetota bacterium]|jgi:hypothetical protein